MFAEPDSPISIEILQGEVISYGSYSPSSNKIEFDEPFGFLSKRLSVREILENGNVVLAYIFDGDYLPYLFHLSKDSPVIIKDYVPVESKETYIQIVISMKPEP